MEFYKIKTNKYIRRMNYNSYQLSSFSKSSLLDYMYGWKGVKFILFSSWYLQLPPKVSMIELILFVVVVWHGLWYLSSLTRDSNSWTAREFPGQLLTFLGFHFHTLYIDAQTTFRPGSYVSYAAATTILPPQDRAEAWPLPTAWLSLPSAQGSAVPQPLTGWARAQYCIRGSTVIESPPQELCESGGWSVSCPGGRAAPFPLPTPGTWPKFPCGREVPGCPSLVAGMGQREAVYTDLD